jgi:MerR family transcriptional regulator, thiopeptide resistance regulator
MLSEALKVGELARRTGLTVRTLHHYDEIGLLKPSLYTEAGHRLYTTGDLARLQQVLSLRQLGFCLEEIRACLDRAGFSPLELIGRHVVRLREQIELQGKLCARLEAVAARLRTAGEVSAEEFLQTIEVMTMMDRYYTPEQQESLRQRAEQVGPERIQQASADWAELHALVRAEMDRGTDPRAPEVQALAQRWRSLVQEFSGGDPGIEQAVKRLWQEQGDHLIAQHGMAYDPRPIAEYLSKAIESAKGSV